jgi:hypothetical protein
MSPEGGPDLDRAQLVERLQNLRSILPVFAQEVASARRASARLRLENARLQEQMRQLRCERGGREGTRDPALLVAAMARRTSIKTTKAVDGVQHADRLARLGDYSELGSASTSSSNELSGGEDSVELAKVEEPHNARLAHGV